MYLVSGVKHGLGLDMDDGKSAGCSKLNGQTEARRGEKLQYVFTYKYIYVDRKPAPAEIHRDVYIITIYPIPYEYICFRVISGACVCPALV